MLELKEQVDESLGFGWGKFLIFLLFSQGIFVFIFGFVGGMETEIIYNREIALVVSLLALGSAFGLYQRRLFGLYLFYFSLILNTFYGIKAISDAGEPWVRNGVAMIAISVLWGMYFKKREAMFT